MNEMMILLPWGVLVAVLMWPRLGLVARWRKALALSKRTRREDALKHILKSEANGRTATLDSIAGALQITTGSAARLLSDLEAHGLLTFEGGSLSLQPAGRELGLHIVRAHRLWESYLAEQTGVAEFEWHQRAERQEHLLTPREAAELSAILGHPAQDPHGDSIPSPDGRLEAEADQSLNCLEPRKPAMITHVEDEPEAVYRQLAAMGLRPGVKVFVIERSAAKVNFWANGNEHLLAPVLAQNISVSVLPRATPDDLIQEEFLSGLRPGMKAKVMGLSPACRTPERRRLLDLGFVPGSAVEIEMVSPAGDPTAYRVRGSIIALRKDQAGLIRIQTEKALQA